MNWTSEEDAAFLMFVAKYGQQWVKIKSPINVNRTRAGLCTRYKCLMEQKKNAAKGIVLWTDKLDKKLLVLAIHEQGWRIVADEFSSSRSTDAKATTVQPAILQARYGELLDAVVHGKKEGKGENSRSVKQEMDSNTRQTHSVMRPILINRAKSSFTRPVQNILLLRLPVRQRSW